MMKQRKFYVHGHRVNILSWDKDGVVYEQDTTEPHTPNWAHLHEITIKYE